MKDHLRQRPTHRFLGASSPTGFVSSFGPGASNFVRSLHPRQSVTPLHAHPNAMVSVFAMHSNKGDKRAQKPGARRNTARRRRTEIMKEIVSSQRLRKQGKWKEAQNLLETVRTEAENDSNYLNEMLHLRVAQLSETRPSISADELCHELYILTDSFPALSNATTFNAILLGVRNSGGPRKKGAIDGDGKVLRVATEVFETMIRKDLTPDHYTMSILFQMSGSNQSLHHTKLFEEKAKREFGFEANVVSGSALLAAYAKCGEIDCVEEVLSDLQTRNVSLNERTYASLISAYHRKGLHGKVMQCFDTAMSSASVKPNVFMFSGALASCLKAKDAANAQKVFEAMLEVRVPPTRDIFSTLLEVAVASGDVRLGRRVLLEWAPQHEVFSPSVQDFTRVIASCKRSLVSAEATRDCLKTILADLHAQTGLSPDVATLNATIGAFITLGFYAEAQQVLEREFSLHRTRPDVVTYNTLMAGLGRAKGTGVALRVYEVMRKNGVAANETTHNTLVELLLAEGQVDVAERVGRELRGVLEGPGDSAGVSARLSQLRREGKADEGLEVYRAAREAGVRLDAKTDGLLMKLLAEGDRRAEMVSLMGWLAWQERLDVGVGNVGLGWFGRQGELGGMLGLFERMKYKGGGMAPDGTSYATVIHFCARGGWLERGFRLLGEMQDVGVGVGETYAWVSLIDGCGRAGQWERGLGLLRRMVKGGEGVPKPCIACFNAGIYAAGLRGGGWKEVKEVWTMGFGDGERKGNLVTYSAMASAILQLKGEVRNWGIVREVCEGGEREIKRSGERDGGKKVGQKMKRLRWLLEREGEGV